MTIRTRIAPSPTGMPHIGTVFQALFDYVWAKKNGGQFLVRIEDTDQGRYVEGAEKAIFDALAWFGLNPDESPIHGGEFGSYRQSERLEIYKKYALELVDSGHAYYCFCTPQRLEEVRSQMQKEGKPPMYDKHCRNLDLKESAEKAKTETHVIRMKIPENETLTFTDLIRGDISFESSTVDDQVILKSDGFPTYHLAVVVDDHLMNITHIIRGEEWITSTPKHLLLYRYFGWEMPQIIHTPLLRNPDKSKLSKRHGHASVSWYQENGYLPDAIINFLATRVWNHPDGQEIFTLEELIKKFEFKDMHIQGPIVDIAKLNWYNGLYIRAMSDSDLLTKLAPYKPESLSDDLLLKFIPLIKERLETLSQIGELTEYLYKTPTIDPKLILKESKVSSDETSEYLKSVIDVLSKIDEKDWTVQVLELKLHELQEKIEWKPRPAFMTIRLGLTGHSATPPLFDILHIIGKQNSIQNLSNAQKILQSQH